MRTPASWWRARKQPRQRLSVTEQLRQHVAEVEARGGVWTRADEEAAAKINAEITALTKRVEHFHQILAAPRPNPPWKDRT